MHARLYRLCLMAVLAMLATAVSAQQMFVVSPSCRTGDREDMALFETGMRIRSGATGQKREPSVAEDYLELAATRGNAVAALALGQMYIHDLADEYPRQKRFRHMRASYQLALDLGCPDAYAATAEAYMEGYGYRKNRTRALELAEKGAKKGSPLGMAVYGKLLMEDRNKLAEGRNWLNRAMKAGYGDAGMALADSYARQKDAGGLIRSLYAGARLGSKKCLDVLVKIYDEGHYGQLVKKELADCYANINREIDDFAMMRPIAQLDSQCGMPAFVLPYKNQ